MKKSLIVKPNTTKQNKTGSWRTYRPVVNIDKCIGCHLCAKLCPDQAIDMVNINGREKSKINYDYCKGCGLCASECPVQAINMELEDNQSLKNKS